MSRLVVRSGHQKDVCYKGIGLCAQNGRRGFRFDCEGHNWERLHDHLKK